MKLDDNTTIYQLFREMLGWHRRRLGKVLNKYGLYSGQPLILHALERMPNSTQKELADALHISSATITTSLQRMEKAGFLTRASDLKDTRCKRITLTEKGKSVCEECHQAFDQLDESMFKGFSAEEQEEIKKYFRGIIANLQAFDEE